MMGISVYKPPLSSSSSLSEQQIPSPALNTPITCFTILPSIGFYYSSSKSTLPISTSFPSEDASTTSQPGGPGPMPTQSRYYAEESSTSKPLCRRSAERSSASSACASTASTASNTQLESSSRPRYCRVYYTRHSTHRHATASTASTACP
ncbi:Protein of unknown function [Pyronema omphalodes CBS 100304]|uniref:Uncharacterized protein n=1 Tax=Pyronema omphalodes (strain CBS 100304) TaxID=1076935 RepID=U4LIQ4_PYROM|nr:Protein of unknown function [Pyronema omphalodes CBS 100304]